MGKFQETSKGTTFTAHNLVLDDGQLKDLFGRLLAGESRELLRKEFGLRNKAMRQIEHKFRAWLEG